MRTITQLEPIPEQQLRGLMGLSVRARQATFGQDACLNAVRCGKAALLLLDGEASGATTDKYEDTCDNAGVPLFRLEPGLLWQATGRPGVAMALPAGGFADKMISLLTGQAGQLPNMKEKKSPRTGTNKCCGGAITE